MTGAELAIRLADLRQLMRDGTDTSETVEAVISAHMEATKCTSR